MVRAVYRARRRNLPVLLLDEPSAALDAPAEQKLLKVLQNEAQAGRIVVVISHRPALIAAADHRVEILPLPALQDLAARDQEISHVR